MFETIAILIPIFDSNCFLMIVETHLKLSNNSISKHELSLTNRRSLIATTAGFHTQVSEISKNSFLLILKVLSTMIKKIFKRVPQMN